MVNLYIKALLISIVIFVSGLFVGLFIERFFVSDLATRTSFIENSVQEIELEMLYFQGLDEAFSCDFLNEIVRKTNNNLDMLAGQLLGYSEKNILFTGIEIKNIKSRYTFLLVKDWLLQERIKKSCGTNTVTILYFYDTEGCDDCVIQGNILTILKNSFKERVMVFPLDVRIGVTMVDILMNRFNITSTPALVIDETVYSGITTKEQLKDIICSKLTEPPEICS